MRRQFTERARLVVYVEAEDLVLMTARAKGEGKTVVEWARERLLNGGGAELGGTREPRGRNGAMADVPTLASEERGSDVAMSAVQTADGAAPKKRGKGAEKVVRAAVKVSGLCRHGARPDLCKKQECRGF